MPPHMTAFLEDSLILGLRRQCAACLKVASGIINDGGGGGVMGAKACDDCYHQTFPTGLLCAKREDTLRSDLARLTSERDAAVAQSHLSDAAARAIGDDFTRVLRECSTLKAEVEAMRGVVSTMEDFAEADCTYGDDCPAFGTRHGRCIGCKARKALDALRARKVGG